MNRGDRHWISRPWATTAQVTICVAVWAMVNLSPNAGTMAALTPWGYRPAEAIFAGAWWALLTPQFIHVEVWHLAFNAYWLWVLGQRFEARYGAARYLLFVFAAAFVTASAELAASDTTGIGASGVGFALFGFAWQTRSQVREFEDAVDDRTVQIFFLWMFACMLGTYLELIRIANAAHVAGLIFGVLTARTLVVTRHRWRYASGLVLLVAAAITVLIWYPWSDSWQGYKANAAYAAGRYEEAVERYSAIIRRDPAAAWALFNRGLANARLGRLADSFSDFAAAKKIDPQIDRQDR